MLEVLLSGLPEFDRWINGHKDRVTRLRLETRLNKATL
jgi:putative component of toxin-antitoxin plasmid stabilization module